MVEFVVVAQDGVQVRRGRGYETTQGIYVIARIGFHRQEEEPEE